MNAKAGLVCVGLLVSSVAGGPARASVVKRLSFAERVQNAALIVRGRVVNLEAVRRGPAPDERRERVEKESRLPIKSSAGQAERLSGAPESLGTEGGSMIFTRVTLEVEEEVKGASARELVFEVAGGVLGGRRAIVHGMPTFERGQRCILFLRSGYETAGDPIVGVDQGFFEIVRDENIGADVVLDANGDFVVGIENDQVISRRNEQRAMRPAPQLGPAPVAEGAGKAVAETSPEVLRFWRSSEAAMSPQLFRQAILSAVEVRQ